MTNKWLSQLEVGDWVCSNYQVAQVEKVMARDIVAHREDGQTVRISKNTGHSQNGGYWSYCEDVAAFKQAIADEKAAKQAKRDEQNARWAAKLDAVRAANKVLNITNHFADMFQVVFYNAKGQTGLIMFKYSRSSRFSWKTSEMVECTRIDSASCYTYHWHDENRSFSTPSGTEGETLEDALIEMIAGSYWD